MEDLKKNLTPESGFNLVGTDYFGDPEGQLYLIEHFDMYQDALDAKKIEKILKNTLFCIKDQVENIYLAKL